ncbi:MAG: serine/threonine kinase PknH, partial [Mycobacterium sp.]|nr:serine/threonine kinase PknH [Mycobacterium sp.]
QQPGGPPSWNQGQPAKRNPWPIIAAVAVVLAVIVAVVGAYLVFNKPPKPPPPPIAADRLSSLLLSVPEINSIMGATKMTAEPYTTMSKSSLTLSDPSCLGALYAGQEPTYSGTGYTGVNGNDSFERSGDHKDHYADQAVVTFPSADKALDFLQTSRDKWKGCAGKTITVTNPSKNTTVRWSVSDLSGSPTRITLVNTQEAMEGWQCQRAMSVANNVIVDVDACAYKLNNQASQISDKIVDKINNQ